MTVQKIPAPPLSVEVSTYPPSLAERAPREESLIHSVARRAFDRASDFPRVAAIAFVFFDLVALSAFIVRDSIARAGVRAGETVPVLLANLAGFGDFKYRIVRVTAVVCATLTCAAFVAARRAPGIRRRAATLAVLLVLYVGTLAALRGSSSNRFREIDLVELPSPVVPPIGPDGTKRESIGTFDDLFRVVAAGWSDDSARLAAAWPRKSPAARRALFFMAAVSQLWPSGQINPSLPGCISNYDRLRGRSAESVRDLLASPYACCADFAGALAGLLEHAGVESRIAILGGHQIVEAKFDGSWHALDANSNTFVDGAWNEIINRPAGRHASVTLLPRAFVTPRDAKSYRPGTGEIRWLVLSWIAERRNPVVEYTPIPPLLGGG